MSFFYLENQKLNHFGPLCKIWSLKKTNEISFTLYFIYVEISKWKYDWKYNLVVGNDDKKFFNWFLCVHQFIFNRIKRSHLIASQFRQVLWFWIVLGFECLPISRSSGPQEIYDFLWISLLIGCTFWAIGLNGIGQKCWNKKRKCEYTVDLMHFSTWIEFNSFFYVEFKKKITVWNEAQHN